MNDKQMNDKQIGTVLRTWMEEESTQKPDRSRVVSNVVGQLRSARKPRRRWWPFRRRSDSLLTTNTTDKTPPPPHLAPVGGTPTITGRTQSMFSPAKAITAGAIVFALGGVLLIAQPFDQQRASVPGAEVALPASTSFTGLLTYPSFDDSEGTRSVTPGGLETNAWATLVRFVSSDPRLTGDATHTMNEVIDPREGCCTFTGLWTGTYELTNDGGSWLGEITGFNSTELGMERGIAILVGQDGYDGLTAIFLHIGNSDWLDDGGAEVLGTKVSGVIIPSSMPEVPEPYAGE